MKRLTLIFSMMIALIGLNANAAIYIVGDAPFGGWNPAAGVEMTLDNGVYTYKATITNSVWFVFADGLDSDWGVFNGTYRYGPTNGDETIAAGTEYTTQRGSNGAYKFTGSGEEYTFTFNPTTLKFKVEGYVEPITEDTYTVAGSLAGLFGSTWDQTDTNNDMTLVNGLYTWSKTNVELPAGAFEFKVVANHDWGTAYPSSNYQQAVEKHGMYDVTITFNADTKDVNCAITLLQEIEDPIIEDHTYTVAGSSTTLFGSEWDPTDTNNDMTLVNGLYTWTKENVALNAGTIEFKVVMDHDWNNGINAWPENNWVANIESNGDYDVTITFNEETKEINFTATPAVIIEDFYTVAGSPAAVFGEEWDPEYAANNMVLDAETGLYTWTADTVALTTADKIEFKVVKNANWSTCWPENNWEYTPTEDAVYDLVITFNAETYQVNFTATKHTEPVVMTSYTVAGPEAVFGSEWDATDTNNDMVLNAETGLYTWTADSVALTAPGFGFKVVGNHDWANEWPQGYDNNWIVNIAEDGDYSLLITFDAETGEINCTATKLGGEEPPVEMVYTVAGPEAVFGSNWDATDENNDMVLDAESGLYTWSKEGVELTGNFGFKVVGNHDWANEWPQGYDNNWIVNIEEAGIYTIEITFNAETGEINCTATKTGDIAPVHYDGDVYILGEVNDNGGWFTNVGVQMTRDAENNVYTATITTAGENIPEGEETGYSYFSFTKQLVDSAADWEGIAPYRFGAVSDGDFWVTDEVLGTEIALENGGDSFRVPAGKWNLTLSVDDMTLVIEKVAEPAYPMGDVNHDNEVDVSDVTALIGYVLGSGEIFTDVANVDGAEGIDVGDVTALIALVLGN